MADDTAEAVYLALAECETCAAHFETSLQRLSPAQKTAWFYVCENIVHCPICHMNFSYHELHGDGPRIITPCGHAW